MVKLFDCYFQPQFGEDISSQEPERNYYITTLCTLTLLTLYTNTQKLCFF